MKNNWRLLTGNPTIRLMVVAELIYRGNLVLEDMIVANDDNKTLVTWSNLLDLFLDFYLSTSANPQKQ